MDHLTDNKTLSRYEMDVDGTAAFVDYAREDGTIVLVHTEVPEALSGQGVGSRLAKAVLDSVREDDGRVVPRCEFIASYIDRHPEYRELVAAR